MTYKMRSSARRKFLVVAVTFERHPVRDLAVVNCVELVGLGCEWVAQGETNPMVKQREENDEHTVEVTAAA
jgi:hypothetical protein